MLLQLLYACLAGVGLLQCVSGTCNQRYVEQQTSRQVTGGVVQTAYSASPATCLAGCNLNYLTGNCIAFDFISSPTPFCYFVPASSFLTAIRGSTSVLSHYDNRVTCVVNNRECTFRDVGPYVLTGGLATVALTEDICRESCVTNAACVAVSYIATSRLCYISTSATTLNARTLNTGAKMYLVYGSCRTVTCPSYLRYKDRNANGALPQGSLTLAACQSRCNANANCYGIIYFGTSCWIHQTPTVVNLLIGQTGYNFYLVNRCSGASACGTNTWTPQPNMHISGGTRQTTITTTAACQSNCIANAACVAVDIKTTPLFECWFHLSSANIQKVTAEIGTTHYALGRCGVMPGCGAPTWKETVNMHAIGGTLQTAITTQSACQEGCKGNPTCVAVDVKRSPFECWFHLIATNLKTKRPKDGINLYEINRCPGASGCGTATWTTKANMHAFGGTKQNTITTESACRIGCLGNTGCVAVDVKASPFGCWFHLSANNLKNIGKETGTTLHELNRCPGGTSGCGAPKWESQANRHAIGGVKQTTITTESTCRINCLGNAKCVAIDVKASLPFECWFHLVEANLNNIEPFTGVTFHKLDRCPNSCNTRWIMLNHTHVPGGVEKTTYTTFDSCRNACAQDTACLAVDTTFKTVSTVVCFFHTNLANLARTAPFVNTYHSRIQDRCPGSGMFQTTVQLATTTMTTTIAAPKCKATWKVQNNTHGFGGVERTQYTTGVACQNACVNDETCGAVDLIYTDTFHCWFHMLSGGRLTATTGMMSGSWFFEIDQRCPGDCAGTWTSKSDTHASGGTPMPAYKDLAACQKACVAKSQCLAIDTDKEARATFCWFHESSANLNNVGPKPNAVHYVLKSRRCDGKCVPTFLVNKGRNGPGGTRDNNLDDLAKCQQACIDNTRCTGVDYRGGTSCYINTDPDVKDKMEPYAANTFYLIDRSNCGCQPKFIPNVNKNGPDGTVDRSSMDTLVKCQQKCIDTPACTGMDYKTGAHCYINTNPNIRNLLGVQQGNTFYLIDRSPCAKATPPTTTVVTTRPTTPTTTDACGTPLWAPVRRNTHAFNGVVQNGLTTLTACMNGCIASPQCAAIDVSRSDRTTNIQCWFLDQANVGVTKGLNNTDFYRLISRCPNQAPPVTQPPGTRPVTTVSVTPASTTTVTVTRTAAQTANVCQPSYSPTMTNQRLPNGVLQNGITSDPQCRTACALNNILCVAIQWNSNRNQCFFHFQVGRATFASGVNSALLANRCANQG